MRSKITVLLLFLLVFCNGCSIEGIGEKYIGSSVPENYTEPEYQKVKDACWNEIEQKANEKHVEPTMDDQFVKDYFSELNSLQDLEEAVKIGIKATVNEAGYKKNEIALMRDLFAQEEIEIMATADVAKKEAEMESALETMAKNANQTKENFLQSQYGMSQSEFDAFLAKKGKEFLYPQ